MESITSTLPSELLSRTFFFLSEHRVDISSCRLVCRVFKDCSSPYFITRVVFAKRLKDIIKLQEVLNHPYFHRHVTELIYDASTFDEQIAYNWTRYVQECGRAPRYLHDLEYEERTRHDQELLRKIESSSGPSEAEMNSEDPDYRVPAAGYYNRVYSLGCHRTLPDYQSMFEAQTTIEKADIPIRVIRRALSGFPALRSVVLTDWRSLASPKESYDECARRLFGNTLAPNFFGADSIGDFYTLMRAVAGSQGARIESFQIGRHLFEGEWVSERHEWFDFNPSRWCRLSITTTSAEPEFVHKSRLMANLRRLDLQIYQPGHRLDLYNLLQNASMLTHLRIHSQLSQDSIDTEENPRKSLATEAFKVALTELHLPTLCTLDLQNWPLFGASLRTFLGKHASTLRIVKLVGCELSHETPSDLAMWAGRNLQLDGVDLKGSFGFGSSGDYTCPDLANAEDMWLSGRHNFVEQEPKAKTVGYSEDGGAYQRSGVHPFWSERRIWQ